MLILAQSGRGMFLADGSAEEHVLRAGCRDSRSAHFRGARKLSTVLSPTSYVALVNKGRMKAGDWVLVHAASGGVGLAACQIAKRTNLGPGDGHA
jgi:hypothetical protein